MRKTLLLLGMTIFTISLVACNVETVAPKENTEAKTSEDIQEAREKREEARKDREEARKAKEQEEANQGMSEEEIVSALQKRMEGSFEVDFDKKNKAFTLIPINEGVIKELDMYASGDIGIEMWNETVDATTDLSETIKEELGEGYHVVLLNGDKIAILWITDGEVKHDVIKDE
ncbi:hypothetical protein NSQ77_19895 [Oceanobacillus sp. FSL K6-2867]|uniref:hypothetical protein n=1 Tax=Oceanobacillus sp. FSL K6-2867 TaxID=2954748 RepID=UPI0030DCB3C7